jgi:hypothetical protein
MKMYPYFWPKNPKANFLKNMVFVSSCNTECYETDLDFSLNNPKAKTNPILVYRLAPNPALSLPKGLCWGCCSLRRWIQYKKDGLKPKLLV